MSTAYKAYRQGYDEHEVPMRFSKIVVWFVNFAVNYVTTYRPLQVAMTFDAQAIFANLTEKERIHGHHSPEGEAIRTLGRALHGWSTRTLSAGDVVELCDQAIADWLKRKLKVSAWSEISMSELLAAAVAKDVLSPDDALRVQRMHAVRADANSRAISAAAVEAMLERAIEIVEQQWP